MADLEYKLHLSRAYCSFGNTENYINVGTDHGVYVYGNEQGDMMPLLNEGDCIAGVHIIHFGTCGAFGTNADEAAKRFQSAPLFSGLFKKAVGAVMHLVGSGVSACTACNPEIRTCWCETKEDYLVDGLPALTENSFITCQKGGVIRFVKSPGAEEKSAQDIVNSVNAVTPPAVVAAMAGATAVGKPSESNPLGVKRQIYENHSTITEAFKDVIGGVPPWNAKIIHDDIVPWAENLAVQYAKDRGMLEYSGDTPITWDNEADALRHFAWSVRMEKEFSKKQAETVASNHERQIFYKVSSGYVRFIPLENLMDEHNNQAGLEYAKKLKGDDYAAHEPYIELFAEAKRDGKIVSTLDDVYRLNPELNKSKETELEVKDLGVKTGLLFLCDKNKEITGQIDQDEAITLVKKYEDIQNDMSGAR